MVIKRNDHQELLRVLFQQFKELQKQNKLPQDIDPQKIMEIVRAVAEKLMRDPNARLEDLKSYKNQNILAMTFSAELANKPQLALRFIKFLSVSEEKLKQDSALALEFKNTINELSNEVKKLHDPALKASLDECMKNVMADLNKLELPTPSPQSTIPQETLEQKGTKLYNATMTGATPEGGQVYARIDGATDSGDLVDDSIAPEIGESLLDKIEKEFQNKSDPVGDNPKEQKEQNDLKEEKEEVWESEMTKRMRQGPTPYKK